MAIIDRHIRSIALNGIFDGGFQIVGSAKNKATPANLPVRRRIRLHDQRTGLAVRETWSDPVDGAYSFKSVAAGTYYVTAFDHTGEYGGVIETDIVAEPMP